MSDVQPIRALASIPLNMIRTEGNVRGQLTGIAELADSIRELGVLQPITVSRRPEGGFTLVFGHRRLAAAGAAGRDAIPALIVGDYLPEQRLERQLAENTGRVPLDPIEEARGFQRLRELGRTTAQVAALAGVSPSTVHARLDLLALPLSEQRAVRQGAVSLGQAKQVAQLHRGAKAPGTLNRAHRLAGAVKAACKHDGRTSYGGVGCGQCWEAAIRDDERGRAGAPS